MVVRSELSVGFTVGFRVETCRAPARTFPWRICHNSPRETSDWAPAEMNFWRAAVYSAVVRPGSSWAGSTLAGTAMGRALALLAEAEPPQALAARARPARASPLHRAR